MRIVMKFGGSSLKNGEMISKTAQIVKDYKPEECVLVVSAMQGVTDQLIETANKIAEGLLDEEEIRNFVGDLQERHRVATVKAVTGEHQEPVLIDIEKLCSELEKVLIGISYVGELTPRSIDYVMSFGERLSAPIVSGALRSLGVESQWLTGYDAGIVTDSNFGRASPIWDLTNERVKATLSPVITRGEVPVVTGFIAGDMRGRITTLSRGGSDFTAAIIGAALSVDEIWIWTDVDGIMSTDPRMVKEARTIKVISFMEAMELAYFGAKVLHPKTIEPAMEKDIPVRVRNTFNPANEGTVIVREQEQVVDVVKAISVMENVALLNVSGVGMIGIPGVAAKVFSALAEEKVNILMISQGSSEVNISIIVEKEDLKKAVRILERVFADKSIVKDVQYNEDVAIIAVVGAGMRGTKGVAARVFKAVADAGVNVLMIAQGSSEVNISFIVLRKDAVKAAKALHDEFIKN